MSNASRRYIRLVFAVSISSQQLNDTRPPIGGLVFHLNETVARVAEFFEIPTPRWTAYEAKRFGVKMKDSTPMITVERAYTSPIWYTP